nr:MAG TPA: hypothetical protein [Caudoviricetes sp.]
MRHSYSHTNSLISNSVLLSIVLGNAFSKSALTLRVAWDIRIL